MKEIIQKLIKGEISAEKAEKLLKTMQILELEDFAKMDLGRDIRTGVPEAVFAEGKEDEELIKILMSCATNGRIMVTRLKQQRYEAIKNELTPLIDKGFVVEYNKRARILIIKD
ncbi:MAG TPA: hypothetical protein VF324_07455, partial [Methanobacterium sp.]